MTDNNIEIEDHTKHPTVIDVRLDGENTVVVVNVHQMLSSIFPDGQTDGDPGVWGVILCDVVRHVARAHRQTLARFSEKGGGPTPPPEEAVIGRIMQVLGDEMGSGDLPKIESHTIVKGSGSKGPKVH